MPARTCTTWPDHRGPVYRLPPWQLAAPPVAQLAERVDWSISTYGIERLWSSTRRGAGVRVAVLDTGCDLDHPDLLGQIKAAQDFTGSPRGVADTNGHGTWCAGMIAAASNHAGLTGVAPEARLLVAKVLGDDGTGSDQAIARAIDWALDHEADLVSLSLGSPTPSPPMQAAIRRALGRGVAVLCAAGNDGPGRLGRSSVLWPARYQETIAVAAVDQAGRLAPFSAVGPEVDLAAPGVGMTGLAPGGQYAVLSGTSMACPFVAGVAALALSSYRASSGGRRLLPEHLRSRLTETARDAGSAGRDDGYGAGLIDPARVVAEVSPPADDVPPPTGGPLPDPDAPEGPAELVLGVFSGAGPVLVAFPYTLSTGGELVFRPR